MLSFYLLLHFSTVFFRLPLVFLVDFILGEPSFIVHPVVLMGRAVSRLEKRLRVMFGCPFSENGDGKGLGSRKARERFSGSVLALVVSSVSFAIPASVLLCILAFSSSSFCLGRSIRLFSLDFPLSALAVSAFFILDLFWGYQCVAARCLSDEASNIAEKLSLSIEEGRSAVARIVGRDTSRLDREGVVKACVESVAESTTDGIFSPLFFYALGGSPLAMLHKAVNTMDSMIAYKNDRYIFFGSFAARFDDALNFIPARLAALFMVLSVFVLRGAFFMRRLHPVRAVKVFLRDRYRHSSPNSAQTESVAAGMLGIRLGGNAVYEGKIEEKEFIGDETREADVSDIKISVSVMYFSSALFVAALSVLFFAVAGNPSLSSFWEVVRK